MSIMAKRSPISATSEHLSNLTSDSISRPIIFSDFFSYSSLLVEFMQTAVTVYVTQKPEMQRMMVGDRGPAIYDKTTENLPKKNACLASFRQSFKYFDHVEDQLRVDLTFKPSILAVARHWLEKVRTAIAVNVSRCIIVGLLNHVMSARKSSPTKNGTKVITTERPRHNHVKPMSHNRYSVVRNVCVHHEKIGCCRCDRRDVMCQYRRLYFLHFNRATLC